MPYESGQGKTAVGLFVDGLQLKYVQLSLTAGRVAFRDFKTVSLVAKLEEKAAAAKEGAWSADAADDAFGVAPDTEAAAKEATTNATVLLNLLGDLPPTKYTVSFALSEPAVTYQEFDTDFGLSGSKLKKKIAQELAATRAESPPLDSLDAIPTASGGLLSIVRQGGLQLYDLLTEIQSSLNGRLPNVKLIHCADLALMELVRSSYEIREEEVSVLVYVGHDFSRLIFMQGNNYLHFAPIISEGYGTANIDNTIYSRIRLEEDNIAVTRINRILLAGESHKVNLLEAIAPRFPNAEVEYVKAPDVDLSLNTETVNEVISEYAIPLAVA